MRDIVKDIIGAPMPVVVYVSPNGARAASAGLYITEAADVASRRGGDDADRDGPAPFNELLRRPAPHYPGTDRPRIR